MLYGIVNLFYGVNLGEIFVICMVGIGIFIVEFVILSSFIGDLVFEDVVRVVLMCFWESWLDIGLVGNYIDVFIGKWVVQDVGIGVGVDFYFEYLVKGVILFQDKKFMVMFLEYNKVIWNYICFDDWYLWVQMYKGIVFMLVFQFLEVYWFGFQSFIGDIDNVMRIFFNYYIVWKQFGGFLEFYNIFQGYIVEK